MIPFEIKKSNRYGKNSKKVFPHAKNRPLFAVFNSIAEKNVLPVAGKLSFC